MAFHPTMRTTFRCWAPGTAEEVEARLERAIRRGDLTGTVRPGDFHVTRPVPGTRNSWRPQLKGTLTEVGGGVLIDVKVAVAPGVFWFTLIHGLMLLGVSWLMGAVAFSLEVPGATEALAKAVEATAVGDQVDAMQVLSDPEDPGAATGAPWAMRARATVDEVQLAIRGRSGWAGLAAARRLKLTIGPAGLELDPLPGPPIDVPWGELVGCSVDGENLVIERMGKPLIEIGAGGHEAKDREWVAAFITARAHERAGTPDEAERARAKLRLVTRGRVPE